MPRQRATRRPLPPAPARIRCCYLTSGEPTSTLSAHATPSAALAACRPASRVAVAAQTQCLSTHRLGRTSRLLPKPIAEYGHRVRRQARPTHASPPLRLCACSVSSSSIRCSLHLCTPRPRRARSLRLRCSCSRRPAAPSPPSFAPSANCSPCTSVSPAPSAPRPARRKCCRPRRGRSPSHRSQPVRFRHQPRPCRRPPTPAGDIRSPPSACSSPPPVRVALCRVPSRCAVRQPIPPVWLTTIITVTDADTACGSTVGPMSSSVTVAGRFTSDAPREVDLTPTVHHCRRNLRRAVRPVGGHRTRSPRPFAPCSTCSS